MGTTTQVSLHLMSFVAMLLKVVGEPMHFPFDKIS